MNTFKSSVGIGILALPYALQSSGLIIGLIGLQIIGVFTFWGVCLLRFARNALIRQGYSPESAAMAVPDNRNRGESWGSHGSHMSVEQGVDITSSEPTPSHVNGAPSGQVQRVHRSCPACQLGGCQLNVS